MKPLRLGTRGSKLALAQSSLVASWITQKTGLQVELIIISTKGDQILNKPLAEIGGKGLFTAELEAALHSSEIDFAVHSLKDLPTEDPDGLCIAAIPVRESPLDVLVGKPLSRAKAIGTGSLRRGEQLKLLSPACEIKGIRGNVDTRLAKLDRGEYDAIVLAAAGMQRLGIARKDASPFSIKEMVPAPAQGALGIQCRSDNAFIHSIVATIHDPITASCVQVERGFLHAIQGGCNVPVGCLVKPSQEGFSTSVFYQSHKNICFSFEEKNLEDILEKIFTKMDE